MIPVLFFHLTRFKALLWLRPMCKTLYYTSTVLPYPLQALWYAFLIASFISPFQFVATSWKSLHLKTTWLTKKHLCVLLVRFLQKESHPCWLQTIEAVWDWVVTQTKLLCLRTSSARQLLSMGIPQMGDHRYGLWPHCRSGTVSKLRWQSRYIRRLARRTKQSFARRFVSSQAHDRSNSVKSFC